MWQFLKKIDRFFSYLILIFGLLIPILLFLNRFLIPDVSFDSTNYHYFLGFKAFHTANNSYEFFPTGIHNFASFFDMFGYFVSTLLGYRLGTITSLIFLYLSIFVLYKLVRLIDNEFRLIGSTLNSFLFVSSFISFELFLELATYYVDILSLFFLLLTTYYLFLFLIKKKDVFCYLSSLFLSLAILGKQTNLFFIFPYFGLIFYYLINNKISFRGSLIKLFFSGLIVISCSLPWYIKNYILTYNPVFPFYNGIFKSVYFPSENFEQVIFGGQNLVQKIFWGVYSFFEPVRLGEVHDLFSDYKINLYFSVLPILFFIYLFSTKKRDLYFVILVIFYFLLFEFWSLQFGYLRYGLILEFLGGILLLIFFNKIKLRWLKLVVFLPIFLVLIIQNKRIVNMSLAYDLSFRPGYYYNRSTYLKNVGALFVSKIENNRDSDDFSPNIYLNCTTQSMTYYALSDYKKLPILNISQRAYSDMVNDLEYSSKSLNRLLSDPDLKNTNRLKFVTIVSNFGLGNEYDNCIQSIEKKGYKILNETSVGNFIGYQAVKLSIIYGELN